MLFQMKDKLKTIEDNSTIIITSVEKDEPDFRLNKIKDNVYKLSISDNVDSIFGLFEDNKKIKKFVFDNWNPCNIKSMEHAFSYLELDELPDFSQLDLSKLENTISMFYGTKINGNFTFKNHTLKKLRTSRAMFNSFQCKELVIDLGKTSLEDATGICINSISDKLKIKIDYTSDEFEFAQALRNSKIEKVDLKEVDMSCCVNMNNMLTSIKGITEIEMPNTIPLSHNIGNISYNIDKIYCNKKWRKIIGDI